MSLAGPNNPVVVVLTARDTYSADQGVQYVATNPTVGTAIAGHAAATTFDETKALLTVYNSGTRTIYPTALRLKLSNAGTGATTVRFEQALDTGNRLSSGGTTLTIGNSNWPPTTSGAIVTFGACILSAPSAKRQAIGTAQYRNVIGVVTDTYGFIWGSGGANLIQMPQTSTAGTSEVDIVIDYAPVAVPPATTWSIHQWSASQSGAYQFEPVHFEYIEK